MVVFARGARPRGTEAPTGPPYHVRRQLFWYSVGELPVNFLKVLLK